MRKKKNYMSITNTVENGRVVDNLGVKHLVFLFSLLLIPALGKAQYNNTYNPYLAAALTAEAVNNKHLDNIRFDPNALMQNPEVWEAYQTYLGQVKQLNKKDKIYTTFAYSGLGIMAVSLIPIFMESSYSYDDPRSDAAFAWGIGLLSTGAVVGTIGCIGALIQSDRIRGKKKDFIYYLKTTNNGIGIVTLF